MMIRLKLAIIVFLSLLCLPMAAQHKVTVTILEKSTELPMVAVAVTYADNEKLAKPQMALTDVNGQATLNVTKIMSWRHKIQ